MELWRELAFEVIQEAPSRIASISSVAKEGLGFSSTCLTGGQGSDSSLSTARLRFMTMSVPMRQPNAKLLNMATPEEYATRPTKRLGKAAAERIPAIPVEVVASSKVGIHSIQCLVPKEIERPKRTCKSVMEATMSKPDCLIVMTTHNLTAEAGSLAVSKSCGPPIDSLMACQINNARASKSKHESQMWLLSAGDKERKFGRPNSDCRNFVESCVSLTHKKRKTRTGATRLLKG